MNETAYPVRSLVWTTLRPVNRGCEEFRRALAELRKKDANFTVEDEDVDGQMTIRAMNELHLENICERLVREHDVYVESGATNVIYLETIRDTSGAEGKFIRQSGGSGHYAHVVLRIEPNPTNGYELVSEMPEGATAVQAREFCARWAIRFSAKVITGGGR